MPFFIHRYELKRKKTNQVQSGCLLKIEDSQGHFGVADLCPWPHLGDLTLNQELEQRGPLFQRALELAQKDLKARQDKVKLNTERPVKNHFLMTEFNGEHAGALVKIKCDQDIQKCAQFLNSHENKHPAFRLDFNNSLTSEQYFEFIKLLSTGVLKKIECIEDPFPFNETEWRKSPVKIASDFIPAEDWPYQIVKPARSKIKKDFLYLTSSMDHPVGVAHGLIEAQNYPEKTHGFFTLDLYHPTTFHQYFHHHKNEISFKSDGYGIGFESELKEIIWEPLIDYKSTSRNEIFYGNHLSSEEKSQLQSLKQHFEKTTAEKGYFLIPSSGSSHQTGQSLKLYAISKPHFLNSAERVNMEFNLTREMNWGCVLPTHHVGGLSILARAHLSHSKVFFNTWKNFSTGWLVENQIQLLSLVPTQVFDLVQSQVKCPTSMKYVFVGGAHLSTETEKVARALGWPLVVTFGMTETSSMVASRHEGSLEFIPFQGVEVTQGKDHHLRIKCNSLAEYCLQSYHHRIEQKSLIKDGYYETEDQVHLQKNGFVFLNRSADQIKINGEGVSLFQLRQKLEEALLRLNLKPQQAALISLPDARRGEGLVLVLDSSIKSSSELINLYNKMVKPFERVQETHTLQTAFPMTELNKIKYQRIKELVLSERQRV